MDREGRRDGKRLDLLEKTGGVGGCDRDMGMFMTAIKITY